MPLIHEGAVIGAVYADDSTQANPSEITKDRQERLTIFAQSAARSYVNSRRFEMVHYKAIHDSLTDLYNHRGLQERFLDDLVSTIENRKKLSLVAFDLDNLRAVNTKIGHPLANLYFEKIAKIINGALPPNAVSARVGGDEFVLVLPDTDTDKAWNASESIRKAVFDARINKEGIPDNFKISISMGVSTYGYVPAGEGYIALIPYTHDERALKIATRLTDEVEAALKNKTRPQIGERVISVEGEKYIIFLFDENKDAVKPLKDQVDALQYSVYEAISNSADTALYVSKQTRNTATVFSVEVQRQREQMDAEELIHAFRELPVAAHRLDKRGVIIDVTDNWLDLLGYTREEMDEMMRKGQKIFDFIPEKNRLKAEVNHRQRMGFPLDPLGVKPDPPESQHQYKIRSYLHKSGREVIVASNHKLNINKKREIIGVTTTLQEASVINFLANRAESSGIDEIAFDQEGNIFYASRGFVSKLGYGKPEQLKGLSILSLFPEKGQERIKGLIKSPIATQEQMLVTILDGAGKPVELPLYTAKFGQITSFIFYLKTNSAGKSLGAQMQEGLTPGHLNSINELIAARTALQPVLRSETDLWANQFFNLTGASDDDLASGAAAYLRDNHLKPLMFDRSVPASSSFLVLDLNSLTPEPAVLSRMAALVGSEGRIFPFYADRESFKKFRDLLNQISPELRTKFLTAKQLTELTPNRIAALRKTHRLDKSSLGFLLSRSEILKGDFSTLVPPGKQAVAFQFEAKENNLVLSKTVYSIAFSTLIDGIQQLSGFDTSLLKKDEKSGLTYFNFDLVALAAALTADWQAETAILRAA
jgi:diguanylate cyclase (GGDEF)-like protein